MCGDKEKVKIIMAVYNEINLREKEEILKHINECDECYNFYSMIKEVKNIKLKEPSIITDNFILSYSKRVIYNFNSFIRRLVYSISFAFVALFIMFPRHNLYYIYETSIYSEISEIEKSIKNISYDFKDFSDFDY